VARRAAVKVIQTGARRIFDPCGDQWLRTALNRSDESGSPQMPMVQRNLAARAPAESGGEGEKSLVARLKAGDGDAAREFFDAYAKRIYRFIANALGGDPRDAEDLLQETFIALAEALPYFRGDSTLFTFACAIAHRKVQSFIRRTARRRQLALEQGSELPREAFEASERDDVARAMNQLDRDYREVLMLKYVEEMKVGEIARVMELSEHAVESRLARARRVLRAMLEAKR
jgi:RNA polymerase sigma factor (sigma-70 family)